MSKNCQLKLTLSYWDNNYRYHEWMQGTELQQLTASEPLSLDEEFEMQEAWRNDADS